MLTKNKIPLISVCVINYNTEKYLEKCLLSIIYQDFKSFEIVIVNDGSEGKDKTGRSCTKIVNSIKKECKSLRKKKNLPPVDIIYIEHRKNLGCMEARRSALINTCGKWITYIDSDDEFAPDALQVMYDNSDGADIVHGKSLCLMEDEEGKLVQVQKKQEKNILFYNGILTGHNIFHKTFTEADISCVLWSKLIKKELYEKVFKKIPFMYCNNNEDYLIYFLLALEADVYRGIDTVVYHYRMDTGNTSGKLIDTISKWHTQVSRASALTVFMEYCSAYPEQFTKKEKIHNQMDYNWHLNECVEIFLFCVVPEIKDECYAMMCEYWGEKNVKLAMKNFRRRHGMR